MLRLLADGAPSARDWCMRSVGDSARYDVFQLAEAAAAGEAARALRVLLGLKSEGVEPTLILWALVRELRGLWQAREREPSAFARVAAAAGTWRPRPRRARWRRSIRCRWRGCSAGEPHRSRHQGNRAG